MHASKYPSDEPTASNLVPTSAPSVPAGADASVTSWPLCRLALTRETLSRALGGSSSSPSIMALFSTPRTIIQYTCFTSGISSRNLFKEFTTGILMYARRW